VRKLVKLLKRLVGAARGRPFAGITLATLLVVNVWVEPPLSLPDAPNWLDESIAVVGKPFTGGQRVLFDAYQRVSPRTPQSQPVAIVAIDEKSLSHIGQWPWPRDQLARLIDAINVHQPAAIGLDIYMPEADQTSPSKLAERLDASQASLAQMLKALPTHDYLLAKSLKAAPTVLGAAGFEFEAYTTTAGMRSVPLVVHGDDPRPFVRQYAKVLASLPELQAAAQGQALLSVDAQDDAVRKIPLLAAVGSQLYPGLAMEMLRVATGSSAVEVTTGAHGVSAVQVADLVVPTQGHGDVWLHSAEIASGAPRYVSARDVLEGRVDPTLLRSKLVLIGLTGAGLNDMRTTPQGELVPGIEMQAQLIESFFDGRFLLRPWWMKGLETLLLVLLCVSLIWWVPRADSRLATFLKLHPQMALGVLLWIDLMLIGGGFALFSIAGLLFDAAAVVLVLTVVLGALLASSLIEDLGETRVKLARLVDNGIMLGREKDRDKLLRQTLQSAQAMANCQRATLFLRTERDTLQFAMTTGADPMPTYEIPLHHPDGKPNDKQVAPYVVLSGKTVVVDNIWNDPTFDMAPTQAFSKTSGLRIRGTLNVPMQSGEGKVIGMIQLMNALAPRSHLPVNFDPKIHGFMEALAAQAAVAIENRNLMEAQKGLMDSMIQIIAGAIDTKSPYTGGHCERVPELAMMLAREACQVKTGALAEFEFKTDEEWREFRIGAWLHDCGKVTTPEYVVDKATKLETIFNRIHEIRTRFEVLLRDAEITRLLSVHEAHADPLAAQQQCDARKAQLVNDFAFVAECNVGGEFMAPDKVERLRQIAQTTWTRNFDHRLGLSSDELARCDQDPAAAQGSALPATELLLADKPLHLFERPPNKALDERYGFKLKVPQYLYNRGELYNLSISRGTLTDEERFKINEHIIQTIVMLEQMPLPPELKRVPEYAGTHHETLTGSGYPRKLDESQLSVPSRIMAIADIFEALTASDRPYKKAKTLSESIKILSFFKKDRHIDPVLFDLFLSSGVYLTYARQYLQPEQIDEVDLSKYLGV
jgi:HD-GYP domain-containing protein (c-di-GMP phosphodiesterase class II)/CHASE2 domain-containing sensor protein